MSLEPDAVRETTVGLVRHLAVRPGDDNGSLIVDAVSLMQSEHEPREWWLYFEDGLWHHFPSGSSGQLAEVLLAIASAYIDFLVSPQEPKGTQ